MAVRDTLNKVENLVAGASHLPLTGKALIDEDELSALIDELRNALPQELDRAEQIIRDRESMIQSAQQQAEKIIKDAQRQAERLVDENDIVLKARKNAQAVTTEAHQQSNAILENARQQARHFQEEVDKYANQVFDQLIATVTNNLNELQTIAAGLEHGLQVLQQAKMTMNQSAYVAAYSQPPPGYQTVLQNYQTAPPPNYQQPPPQNYQQPPQQNYQQQPPQQNYQQQPPQQNYQQQPPPQS